MKLILILLLITSVASAQGLMPEALKKVNTMADLKKFKGEHNAYAYMTGKDSIADGQGGSYRYDTASTTTADNYNVIQVTGVTKGRWIRANQTTINYTQGTIFKIGPLKIFTGMATIAGGNGEVLINLTNENTANGTAFFTNVLFASAMAEQASSNSNDVVIGNVKNIGAGNKTITFRFATGATVSVLGAASLRVAGNGLNVRYIVLGN